MSSIPLRHLYALEILDELNNDVVARLDPVLADVVALLVQKRYDQLREKSQQEAPENNATVTPLSEVAAAASASTPSPATAPAATTAQPVTTTPAHSTPSTPSAKADPDFIPCADNESGTCLEHGCELNRKGKCKRCQSREYNRRYNAKRAKKQTPEAVGKAAAEKVIETIKPHPAVKPLPEPQTKDVEYAISRAKAIAATPAAGPNLSYLDTAYPDKMAGKLCEQCDTYPRDGNSKLCKKCIDLKFACEA